MKHLNHKKKKLLEKIGIVILSLLCVGSFVWFFISANELYRQGDLQPDYTIGAPVSIQHHATVTVASIQTWMTFNYLNVVFKLPPSFLQNALAVTDTRYPNIRIDSYARQHHLNLPFFLKNLQQAITSHSAAAN